MPSHHCKQFVSPPLTRRDMLRQCAGGFGAVALAALLNDRSFGAGAQNPLPSHLPHYGRRARNVIFLYMDGGPSQVDTFDPKPRLIREHGQPFKMKIEPTQFDKNGTTLGSPWKFQQYGQSGTPVSDLFPHIAQHVDDLAVIRSMTSEFSSHTSANYLLHTGSGLQGLPSMGAWVNYGLGSECQNLPGFVVLNGGLIPLGGLDTFGSGFLPTTYQPSIFHPQPQPIANLQPSEAQSPALQRSKLALLRQLDRQAADRLGSAEQVESAIANYELAFRMQAAVPDLMKFDDETADTLKMYGCDAEFKPTQIFAQECLIARRLIEQGVRFVEVTCPIVSADRWDQHGGLKEGHESNARAVDQPIGALLTDLKQRGLLDETLIVWTGEFGRTPFAQDVNGRDHNPFGFSLWLAGGGVKGGTIYGATDEYGYKAIDRPCDIHDLHATMLHLLGLDHEHVTYRFGGRDMRLTDVYGTVIEGILA
jgi:hypothetical protein